MWSLAVKTLFVERGKLLIALSGVVFSLVLVSVQGGLFLGLIQKTSVLVDNCRADIWVGPRGIKAADLPGEIPVALLDRLRGLPGVRVAEPCVIAGTTAALPNGDFEHVIVVGAEPDSKIAGAWGVARGTIGDLRRPSGIMIDELDAARLGNPQLGQWIEINGRRARIVGMTHGVQNFVTTPVVFSALDAAREFGGLARDECSFFLIQLEPNQSAVSMCQRIQHLVPTLDVYTAAGFRQLTHDYWMNRTGIGASFGTATLLGLLVGFLMVGQSLYALALDHLTEYATLKAIGADDGHVSRVILCQALSIAVGGSVMGVAVVLALQRLISSPVTPIVIPVELLAGGIATVVLICLVASILPFVRIRRVDLAVVLQG